MQGKREAEEEKCLAEEIESARGLRPLFDEDMSAGESPADIHETMADNVEDAAKAPEANHPTMQTR